DMICDIFFFFQAEDGIRFFHVTGVQTCALPIYTVASWGRTGAASKLPRRAPLWIGAGLLVVLVGAVALWALGTSGARAETNLARSEERRVGIALYSRSNQYEMYKLIILMMCERF